MSTTIKNDMGEAPKGIEFSKKIKWSLVTKKLTELKPYEINPRKITEKGLSDPEDSIEKFGLAEPIVINTNGIIIGGHARYFALKKRGAKDAQCYVPSYELTENEMKELNVRLNKNIAGEWDFDILANHFELDDLTDWGFTETDFGIGSGSASDPFDDDGIAPKSQYGVIVECEGEDQQEETFKKLSGMGYSCKVVVT